MLHLSGKRALLELLRQEGVEFIFGNPGTTELPLMDAMVHEHGIRYVLGLHEGAVLSMADGYAQASGKVGVVNLHAGPGLGNAMGMLYDAMRAGSPLLVTAGQHDQRFTFTEPVLWADLPGMARPLVKWSGEVNRFADLPRAVHRAVKVAMTPPTGPVFLSIPADVLMTEDEIELGHATRIAPRFRADAEAVAKVVDHLLAAKRPVLIAGDAISQSDALSEMVELAETLGAPVFFEGAASTASFPATHPLCAGTMGRLVPALRKALERYDVLFSVGGELFTLSLPSDIDPVPPGLTMIHMDNDPWEIGKNYPAAIGLQGDAKATLPEITAALRARLDEAGTKRAATRRQEAEAEIAASRASLHAVAAAEASSDQIRPTALMAALGDAIPTEAVVIDESMSSRGRLRELLKSDDARSFFGMRGGGIGWSLPAAVGAKLAQPSRPVVAITGDGSALYSCQALWTAAHEQLAGLVFVILNNGGYRILKQRTRDLGGNAAQTGIYPAMDLVNPAVDYQLLAKTFGLRACRVATLDALRTELAAGIAGTQPVMIEVMLDKAF